MTITNILSSADFTVVVTNSVGSVTSSVATVTVLPTFPATNITMLVQEPQGNDWETASNWSINLPASQASLQYPGSTFEVLPGARFRTPAGAANTNFPGDVLYLDGDGVFLDNQVNTTIGEIRFKHANPGTVFFRRLVMRGGQLDSGDNGPIIITGQVDILANTPIYVDNAAGQDRPFQIDAWLTGNGSVEYHAFDTTVTGDLNITGTSNTYSGTWNVVQGPLLGSGTNSLGTNSITVGAGGALETLYDINSPGATLFLKGQAQMFLHQNDTFRAVGVGCLGLPPGTYTFAQLNAAYPANFPATWTPILGSSFSTGSGSITVLGTFVAPRARLRIDVSGTDVVLSWPECYWLMEANDVTGPYTTNSAAASPYTVTPSEARKFYGLAPQYAWAGRGLGLRPLSAAFLIISNQWPHIGSDFEGVRDKVGFVRILIRPAGSS